MKNPKKSKGEQVFAGTVDAVLADKIASHAKKNAGNGRYESTDQTKKSTPAARKGNLKTVLVIALTLGIISILIYSFLKKLLKRDKLL
ncbi:MAG: hypothetical protein GF350_09030 [Chitinivibrionales bacterium]|nr:hypothetical protein [Chitinivibrionales bacterium]